MSDQKTSKRPLPSSSSSSSSRSIGKKKGKPTGGGTFVTVGERKDPSASHASPTTTGQTQTQPNGVATVAATKNGDDSPNEYRASPPPLPDETTIENVEQPRTHATQAPEQPSSRRINLCCRKVSQGLKKQFGEMEVNRTSRTVVANTCDEAMKYNEQQEFADNVVTTSKYTPMNFLFKYLWFQFHRFGKED